jgi:hypothetical protein
MNNEALIRVNGTRTLLCLLPKNKKFKDIYDAKHVQLKSNR